MATASMRVKLLINLPTPSPTSRQYPKSHPPTYIVAYEEENYTPIRVETDLIYGRTPSYNKQHQNWLRNLENQVKDTPNFIANCF